MKEEEKVGEEVVEGSGRSEKMNIIVGLKDPEHKSRCHTAMSELEGFTADQSTSM